MKTDGRHALDINPSNMITDFSRVRELAVDISFANLWYSLRSQIDLHISRESIPHLYTDLDLIEVRQLALRHVCPCRRR